MLICAARQTEVGGHKKYSDANVFTGWRDSFACGSRRGCVDVWWMYGVHTTPTIRYSPTQIRFRMGGRSAFTYFGRERSHPLIIVRSCIIEKLHVCGCRISRIAKQEQRAINGTPGVERRKARTIRSAVSLAAGSHGMTQGLCLGVAWVKSEKDLGLGKRVGRYCVMAHLRRYSRPSFGTQYFQPPPVVDVPVSVQPVVLDYILID